MFRKSRISIILFVIVLILTGSCSEYEKLLKSDDFQKKYDAAMEYYENGDYVRSATLIEQILPIYSGTQRAAILNFTLANCYYKRRDYILASFHFDNFVRNYQNDQNTKEAAYMRAYCNYLLSPRPSLDQTATRKAIDQFRMFLTRFPESERAGDALKLIDEMNDKLLEKSFMSARLYFDMGDYKSAIIALKNSLIDFPNTRHREEIMFLILKSSFLLADNSVLERQLERFQTTLNEYYLFIEEFPESSYMNEAQQYLNSSLRVLDNYPTDDLTQGY